MNISGTETQLLIDVLRRDIHAEKEKRNFVQVRKDQQLLDKILDECERLRKLNE